MTSCNFVLSFVGHEKSFITSGPGFLFIELYSNLKMYYKDRLAQKRIVDVPYSEYSVP